MQVYKLQIRGVILVFYTSLLFYFVKKCKILELKWAILTFHHDYILSYINAEYLKNTFNAINKIMDGWKSYTILKLLYIMGTTILPSARD